MKVEIVDGLSPDLGDALYEIYTRVRDVLIVKNVYDKAAAARAVAELTTHPERYGWTHQARPDKALRMQVLGRTLTPVSGADFDLDAYFDIADRFRVDVARLLPDFITTTEEALAAMSGGRDVAVPSTGGRHYTPATIRDLPPGHDIPVHCGNFFLGTSGYRDLSQLVAVDDQLSYFTPLQVPDGGGALLVYDLEWGDPATPTHEGGMYNGDVIEQREPAAALTPGVGDLLVFDGGRYYHKVSHVEGPRHRWTIGGFVGLTKDLRGIRYWS